MKVSDSIHDIVSEDNSPTLFSEVFGESYRSASGAVTESGYIFLENGLLRRLQAQTDGLSSDDTSNGAGLSDQTDQTDQNNRTIRILEYGFGTGLNALVTAAAADRGELPAGTVIEYTSLDLYPLDEERCSALHYDIDCPSGCETLLRKIHSAPWTPWVSGAAETAKTTEATETSETPKNNHFQEITPNFRLRKVLCDFTEYNPLTDRTFSEPWIDVVYFDPFSPDCEPECWSEKIFSRIAAAMRPGAVLSTYSAKGDVKRALRAAGLTVHRIPGTGRKRHNLVAVNNS